MGRIIDGVFAIVTVFTEIKKSKLLRFLRTRPVTNRLWQVDMDRKNVVSLIVSGQKKSHSLSYLTEFCSSDRNVIISAFCAAISTKPLSNLEHLRVC